MFLRILPLCGLALVLAVAGVAHPLIATAAADCPEGGTIRFGVEPYETAAHLIPVYEAMGKQIGDQVGCPVEVYVATSYNAEIEAMRNNKLDVGEFGPLGYVFAHQVAGAQAFATYDDANGKPSSYTASIVTWQGSGISKLADIKGHTFAFSDPASTSGHLMPAYGLRKAGLDPDTDVKPLYAGSHSASFEAIRAHKVDAGELNSVQIASAQQANEYTASDYTTLWKSSPIPNDPIAIRGSLSSGLKSRIEAAILAIDLTKLAPDMVKILPSKGTTKFVAQPDSAYGEIRDLVKTLNVDVTKL